MLIQRAYFLFVCTKSLISNKKKNKMSEANILEWTWTFAKALILYKDRNDCKGVVFVSLSYEWNKTN